MKYTNDYCPTLHAFVGESLIDVMKRASDASCKHHSPIMVHFEDGVAVPADTKFYDACFMGLEQTQGAYNPEERMKEVSLLRSRNVPFSRDMKFQTAFYMKEIISQNPEKAQNFSEQDLADAYPILSKTEVPEYKACFNIVEKELAERFPQRLEKLKEPTKFIPNNDGLSL